MRKNYLEKNCLLMKIVEFIHKNNHPLLNHQTLKLPKSIQENSRLINNKCKKYKCSLDDYKIKIFVVDKKMQEYFQQYSFLGTTFSHFVLQCKILHIDTHNLINEYESKIENFIEILLKNFECCVAKDRHLEKNDKFNIIYDTVLYNKEDKHEFFTVKLELELSLNIETKLSLYKKINETFTSLIEEKRIDSSSINQILDNYFPEVSNTVKLSLSKSEREKREDCCNCILY